MDTRQKEREAAPTGGPQDRRFRASLGWGPGVLAVVALVAVIGAAIWAVASGDGSSDRPGIGPVSSTPPRVVSAEEEDAERIYLWDPNTGDVRVALSAPAHAADAELSPDGEQVVYERQSLDGRRPQVYLSPSCANTHRTPPVACLQADVVERRLTDLRGGAYDPTWSPDGSRIAFSAIPGSNPWADTDIFVMNADGGHIRRLVGTAANDVDPNWSPDGSHIAFHSRRFNNTGGIWVAAVRTRTLTRLTPNDARERWVGAMDPEWSPNGRWIAYSRYSPRNTMNGRLWAAELWLMRSDGTHKHQISEPDGNRVKENPSWSPDGRLIVFEHHGWDGGQDHVRVINLKTGRERSLLAGDDFGPSWSKEGILVSLPSWDNLAPEPRPLKIEKETDASKHRQCDATITFAGSRCQLDGANEPIDPGKLRLELVNDSHFEVLFHIVRLKVGLAFADLRADSYAKFRGEKSVAVDPLQTKTWSSKPTVTSSWAVICWEDIIQAPNGIQFTLGGIAGPVEVD